MRWQRSSQTKTHKTQKAVTQLKQSVVARLIGSAVLLFGVLTAANTLLQVQATKCVLDTHECPAELGSYTQHFLNLPMLGYNYAQILEQQPYPLPITLHKVEKYLPSTLVLYFETQPLAYKLTSGDQTLTISSSGQVFTESNLQAPLTISLPNFDTAISEHQVQPKLHECFTALAQPKGGTMLPPGKLSWLDKDTITLIMDGEPQTVFLDCDNPTRQINALTLILSSPEYQEKKASIKEIDLRFELPVLRMQP